MTNSSLMCWPRGNDVSLTVYLYEPQVDEHGIPVRDQQGNIVWEPVDVDAYDEWRVRVKTDEYIPLSAAAGATAGTLVVKVPGTFPCGVYAVEFTGMKNGFAVRSFETTMFGIVESNGDANVTFDIVDGERSCDIDIKIQMVPFSVERGKNAYELWKEQPGNEDKTLQDYLDSLEPVQADWTEADPNDKAFIKHKPTLAAVATSGDYNDLQNKPITTLERGTNLDTITKSGLYYVTEWPDSLLVVFTPYPNNTRQCLVTGEGKLKSRVQSNGTWSVWSETYYIKPSGGIPKTDLASAVQTSLNKADSALQSQVQSDWDETNTNSPAYIKHKPTSFAQEQADWNETDTTAPDYIKNKPTFNSNTFVKNDYTYSLKADDNTTISKIAAESDPNDAWGHGGSETIPTIGLVRAKVNSKYTKPSGGIPKSDLANSVQTSLNNADNAIALIGDINSILDEINGEVI